MSLQVFIPADTTAIALGADEVAAALSTLAPGIEIVRTGSRGAYWLEPLIEIEQDGQRCGFANITTSNLPELFNADGSYDREHATSIGAVDALPWFRDQQRITFCRAGVIAPTALDDYVAHGGFRGLRRALSMSAAEIVDEILQSGLRGRGGAAFPAGIKWRTVLEAQDSCKYVVCNADEGDSGTFADRLLMESDPLQLVEGMIIAGIATGATQGYIYVRSEYPLAFRRMCEAVAAARAAGYLGENVCERGQQFEVDVRLAAGSYVCGEETALLESLEGKRGMVRAKPPLPAHRGLFNKPTLIHNVLSLAAATSVLADGAEAYQSLGCGRSLGTTALQLAGNVRRGGLVELAFGVKLQDVLEQWAGGTASGKPIAAVQIGGPLGAYLSPAQFETALDYESLAAAGGMLGHGGIVIFDETVDLLAQARFAMEFCAAESCGKCTPCRIGAVRGVEVIDRIRSDENRADNIHLLNELCETMTHGSLCAMGGLTPLPVQSALRLAGHLDNRS